MNSPDQADRVTTLEDLSTSRVRLARDGDIVTLTVTQAASFNAQDRGMLIDLNTALTGIELLEPLPRILILAAEGDRFVGAAQPEYLMAATPDEGEWASGMGQSNGRLLDRMPVVTIAAVQAAAIGGGLEMAMACDLTYASEGATFAQAETRGGVVPGFGGTFRLPRRVGAMRARWMTYSGLPIDARTALQWGLVMDVFPHAELQRHVHDAAQSILKAQPDAVRAAKSILSEASELPLEAANRIERLTFGTRMQRAELSVGMQEIIRDRDASANQR